MNSGFAARRMESKSIDYAGGAGLENPLRNSLAETAKRRIKAVGLPNVSESEQRQFGHHGDFRSSPKKSQEGRDVVLKDMLDVPD